MRRTQKILTLGAAVISALLPAGSARADVFFDQDGATIGNVIDYVMIGYNTHRPITVYADENTFVGYHAQMFNNSTLEMSGGTLGFSLECQDRSVFRMSGGTVDYYVIARNRANAYISGGSVGDLTAYETGKALVTGGTIDRWVDVFDMGSVRIEGGSIGWGASVFDQGKLVVTGGSIAGDIEARQNSVVHLLGGSLTGRIISFGSGTVNVYGTGLQMTDPQPVIGGGTSYHLTGTLADGTPVDTEAMVLETGSINLLSEVPRRL